MFVDLDWPLNASNLLSASAELLVSDTRYTFQLPTRSLKLTDQKNRNNNTMVVPKCSCADGSEDDRLSFAHFYPSDVESAVYATATWLGGWLGEWLGDRHTPVLYQNGQIYLKTFSPSGSPIILVSSDPCADTQFQGESLQPPSSWCIRESGLTIIELELEDAGGGKIYDFRRK